MINPSRSSSGVRSAKSAGGGGPGGGGSASPTAPPLSLSSRENSCTSALFLPRYGRALHHAVLDALREASQTAEYENFCAEKIQATYRMFRQRKSYAGLRRSVLAMQRIYRGHLVRQAVKANEAGEDVNFELACFHYYATRIQAIFRGYHSRKYIDDYYARRAYIRQVAAQSETVRRLADEERHTQDDHGTEDRREKEQRDYTRATEKVHFLLSTVGRSGVYRRCVEATGAATEPYRTNVEDDIRRNAQRVRREQRAKEVHDVKARDQAKRAELRAAAEEAKPTKWRPYSPSDPAKKKKGDQGVGAGGGSSVELSNGVPGQPVVVDSRYDEDSDAEGGFERLYMKDDLKQLMTNLSHRNSNDSALSRSAAEAHEDKQKKKKKKQNGRSSHPGRYGLGCGISPDAAVVGEAEKPVGPHMLSPSVAQSCYWEEPSSLPPQRPLIAPSSCCRRHHPDNYKTHSTPAAESPDQRVTAIQTWPTPSHFSQKYRGKGHDCLPPVPSVTQSTYNTQPEELRKSVDKKYVSQLHQNTLFKVSCYPPPLPAPLTREELHAFQQSMEEKRQQKAAALAKLPKGPRPEDVAAI